MTEPVQRSTRVMCVLFALAAAVAGCRQRMADQPSYRPFEPSNSFADGRSARPIIPGTVPRAGFPLPAESGRMPDSNIIVSAARDEPIPAEAYTDALPGPVTATFLARGRDRYMIFCVVCHDPAGTGRGIVVQRGFTQPPSLHTQRLREAPTGYIFEVVTHGFGAMPDYSAQIPPRDRWAIVGYVRALQWSQYRPLDELPEVERKAALNELESDK